MHDHFPLLSTYTGYLNLHKGKFYASASANPHLNPISLFGMVSYLNLNLLVLLFYFLYFPLAKATLGTKQYQLAWFHIIAQQASKLHALTCRYHRKYFLTCILYSLQGYILAKKK